MPANVEHRYTFERFQCIANKSGDEALIERWAMRQAYVGGEPVGGAEHVQLVSRPRASFASVDALYEIADSDIPPAPGWQGYEAE